MQTSLKNEEMVSLIAIDLAAPEPEIVEKMMD